MSLTEEAKAEITAAVEASPGMGESPDEASDKSEVGDVGDVGADNETKFDDERNAEGGDENETPNEEGADEQAEDDDGQATGKDSKEETVENVEQQVQSLGDDVIALAVRAGLPLSAIRRFESDGELLDAVDSVTNTLAPKETEGEQEDLFGELPKLDPETYGQEAVEMFDKLKGVIQRQQDTLNEFREQQQDVVRSSQTSAARDVKVWFDKEVEGLGNDYAEALGSGGYDDQPQGSAQLTKRDAIASQMAVMLAGYQASGIRVPPRGEVFEAAAHLVLRKDAEGIKQGKLSKKLASRGKQHMQRAGGSSTKTKNNDPYEDTVALLDQKFGSGRR